MFLFIRFEGIILALLLVSFALQNLSVHAGHDHQGVSLVGRRLMAGNLLKETQENDAAVKKVKVLFLAQLISSTYFQPIEFESFEQKVFLHLSYLNFEQEPVDGISSSHEAKIGGRTMVMKFIKKKDAEIKDSRTSTGDAQKLNVEANKNASKKGPQDFLEYNQEQKYTSEMVTINPNRRLQKQVSSFNTKNVVSNEDLSKEWRNILEEADKKVMQMMRRDYSGMRRPRRKPPINNQQPRN
ncbi:hypothetical protein LXL04_006464 [Taraxacum kok-saghyz]